MCIRDSIVAYADDAMFIVEGRSRADLESRADRALGVVSGWCRKVKLELSVNKTSAMMLKNKFHRERRPRITLKNEQVRMSDTVKYLGLLIQEDMTYSEHVVQQTRKVITAFLGLIALTLSLIHI